MSTEILAPMSGVIKSIEIMVGSEVKDDDSVVIMEAMKMETDIYAPADGTVKEILVSEGANVEEGDVLAIIG